MQLQTDVALCPYKNSAAGGELGPPRLAIVTMFPTMPPTCRTRPRENSLVGSGSSLALGPAEALKVVRDVLACLPRRLERVLQMLERVIKKLERVLERLARVPQMLEGLPEMLVCARQMLACVRQRLASV
jgi:hypothetical protein